MKPHKINFALNLAALIGSILLAFGITILGVYGLLQATMGQHVFVFATLIGFLLLVCSILGYCLGLSSPRLGRLFVAIEVALANLHLALYFLLTHHVSEWSSVINYVEAIVAVSFLSFLVAILGGILSFRHNPFGDDLVKVAGGIYALCLFTTFVSLGYAELAQVLGLVAVLLGATTFIGSLFLQKRPHHPPHGPGLEREEALSVYRKMHEDGFLSEEELKQKEEELTKK